MKVQKVYIETSVLNFVFADDAPEKKADAQKLFAEIKAGLYESYTTDYVLQELMRPLYRKLQFSTYCKKKDDDNDRKH
jgi:predicted nucleic acid-binding protein